MRVRAWVSDDGQSCRVVEYAGSIGLLAWWRELPGIIGVMVLFPDGTRHRMEATEFYAIRKGGLGRRRFWNGDCFACAPYDAEVKPGIEVPDALYDVVSETMSDA